VSPARRRKAVSSAAISYTISERHACRVIGQYRTSQRYKITKFPDEDALTAKIIEFASIYGRYGYRRITALSTEPGVGLILSTIKGLRGYGGSKGSRCRRNKRSAAGYG